MPDQQSSNAAVAVEQQKRRRHRSKRARKPRKLPPYNVVLLDDNEHTYQYVIDMLGSLFGYDRNKAYQLAEEVDRTGRVILLTTTKEHAELKRDQIHAFGPDKRIQRCAGSMSAVIEPVS